MEQNELDGDQDIITTIRLGGKALSHWKKNKI
jgi:hypothetical protein